METFQLLTHYSDNSHFRNLPFSTANFLTVEADNVSVAFNIFDVSQNLARSFQLSFDRIEHTTSLLHEIKPYIVYG